MNNKFTIRGVRPSISSNQKAEELIENKYLSFGVDSYLKISKPSKFYYLTLNYYANKSYSHSFKRKYRIITRQTVTGETAYSIQRYEGFIFKTWEDVNISYNKEIAENYFNHCVNPKPFIPEVIKESDYV